MLNEVINSVKLGIKGRTRIIAEKDGKIIYDHEQNNLWLDNGVKRLGYGFINYITAPYLCLSSNTTQPNYTDTSIPNLIIATQHTPTREDSDRRWKFEVNFSAPSEGTSRDIRTVGLSAGNDGSNAYCYTVLTTPLLQDDKTIITVFYYVYVNSPSYNSNIGYGYTVNDYFFKNLFASSGGVSRVYINNNFLKNIYTDENLDIIIRSITQSSVTSKTIESADYSYDNFRYDSGNIDLGSSSNLNAFTGWWSTLFISIMGPIMPFNFNTFGRVWGKQYLNNQGAQTNPIDFYDTNYPTYGYMKAIQAKAKSYPYMPPTCVNNAKYIFSPIVNGGLTATSSLETTKYYFTKSDNISTSICMNAENFGSVLKIFSSEILYNKFGNRDFIIYGNYGTTSSTENTGTYISNIKDGSGSQKINNIIATFPIYDTVQDYANKLYSIDITSNEKDIYKHESSDSKLTSITTSIVGTCSNKIHHAIMCNDKNILLWNKADGKVTTFNTVNNTFSDTWINSANIILNKSSIINSERSWGDYDPETNRIYILQDSAMIVVDKDRLIDYNNFNGTASFSETIKDWSSICTNGGSLRTSSGKLYLKTGSINNIENTSATGKYLDYNRMSQIVNGGPFEATVYLSSFNPRGDSGYNFGLDITNFPQAISELSGKRIELLRSLTDFKYRSSYIENNVESPITSTSAINTVSTKGSNLSISQNGALYEYSADIKNATRLFDGVLTPTTYTALGSGSPTTQDQWVTWKFNTATKVNRVEVVIGSSNWKIDYLIVYGSNDNTNWDKLYSSGKMVPFTSSGERRIYSFDNNTEYLYYKIERIAENVVYTNIAEIELYYDDPTVFSANNTKARFKITRDSSNIVRTYYSTDDISVLDNDATWVLLGDETFTLSGRVSIGISGGSTNRWNDPKEIEISSFKINSGLALLDRKINSIYLTQNDMQFYPFNRVANDSRAVSKHGTVITFNDKIHALTSRAIVSLDKDTFNIIKTKWFSSDKSEQRFCSYFHDDKDKNKAGAFLINSALNRGELNTYNSRNIDIYHIKKYYIYEKLTDEWVLQQYPIPVNDNALNNQFHTGLIYNNSISIFNAGVVYSSYNISINRFIDYCKYDWNSNLQKWIMTDWTNTPTGKLCHQAWEDCIEDVQIRCVNNPISPSTSFSNMDRYELCTCREGIVKDNQQYITGLRLITYFADARQGTETISSTLQINTLSTYTNNESTWIKADFNDLSWVLFTDSSDIPAYYSDYVTNCNISEVTDQSHFKSTSLALAKGYNYYFGSYIKIGNEIRKILAYDSYDKSFITEEFTTTLTTSLTFTIVKPSYATKQGTAPSAGQVNTYYINETTGELHISPDDTGKKLTTNFIYLLRSW